VIRYNSAKRLLSRHREVDMKGPILAAVAVVSLSGCGSGEQKEDKGGETFERMVILEEDPSSVEAVSERKDEFKVR
jgi:hypothetical protein